MLVFLQKPEDQYYEVIESKGPSIVLFGETSEHWTAQTVEFLERSNASVFFLPWSKVQSLRLQLGLTRYPFLQLWREGKCLLETTGYQEDALDELVNNSYTLKK